MFPSEGVSDAILALLYEHCTAPQFIYRHRWSRTDVVMWDNRATMHRASAYGDQEHKRDMRRVTTLDVDSPLAF